MWCCVARGKQRVCKWWRNDIPAELIPDIHSVKAQLTDLMLTLNAFEDRLLAVAHPDNEAPEDSRDAR